jgi:hypothetical protein
VNDRPFFLDWPFYSDELGLLNHPAVLLEKVRRNKDSEVALRAGGVNADGNLCARADSTRTRIVDEDAMATSIRLIFAY